MTTETDLTIETGKKDAAGTDEDMRRRGSTETDGERVPGNEERLRQCKGGQRNSIHSTTSTKFCFAEITGSVNSYGLRFGR